MRTRKGLLLIIVVLAAAGTQPLLRGVTVAESESGASEEVRLPAATVARAVRPRTAAKPRVRLGRTVHAATPLTTSFLPVIDQPEIQLKHKQIANEVLMLLPEQCRGALKQFYVRYDNPKQRGLAGKSTLILSGNVSDAEFRALLVHELGHVFDLNPDRGCLAGSPLSGESEFRDGADPVYQDDPSLAFYRISWAGPKAQKPGSTPADFVSGYAAWDVFEDFAESHAYFVLHNELFAQRATENAAMAAKYAWFRANLYPNGVDLASTNETWKGSVPWDITKLAYDWGASTIVANSR